MLTLALDSEVAAVVMVAEVEELALGVGWKYGVARDVNCGRGGGETRGGKVVVAITIGWVVDGMAEIVVAVWVGIADRMVIVEMDSGPGPRGVEGAGKEDVERTAEVVSVLEVGEGTELKTELDDDTVALCIETGPEATGMVGEGCGVIEGIVEAVEELIIVGIVGTAAALLKLSSTVTTTVLTGPSTSTVWIAVIVFVGPGTDTVVASEASVTVSNTVVAAAPACVAVEPPSTGTTE